MPATMLDTGWIERNIVIDTFNLLCINYGILDWTLAFNNFYAGATYITTEVVWNNTSPAGDVKAVGNSLYCNINAPMIGIAFGPTDTTMFNWLKIAGCRSMMTMGTNTNNLNFMGLSLEGNGASQVNNFVQISGSASNLLFDGVWLALDGGKGAFTIAGTANHILFGPVLVNSSNFSGAVDTNTGSGTEVGLWGVNGGKRHEDTPAQRRSAGSYMLRPNRLGEAEGKGPASKQAGKRTPRHFEAQGDRSGPRQNLRVTRISNSVGNLSNFFRRGRRSRKTTLPNSATRCATQFEKWRLAKLAPNS